MRAYIAPTTSPNPKTPRLQPPDPNPRIPCEKVVVIYGHMMLVNKTYYSHLHMKSVLVCPKATRAIEITDVCLLQADLYAGAVFMKQSMGWDIWGSVIALLVLAMIFTVAGKTSSCLNIIVVCWKTVVS